MAWKRKLRFGFALPGASINKWGWIYSSAPPDASVNPDYFRTLAQQAERAKLDFLFVADGVIVTQDSPPHFLNRFEPLTILSALASVTSRIGLVGTVATSFADPFTVARQFASLDLLSGGRAGWNLVTGDVAQAAENFTNAPYLPHDERYRVAEEHLAVVQGLWDSWEDDAFLYDRSARRFADTAKLHALNHEGPYFKVRGPLNIARSPQGQPVIFQAGASEIGRDFAARRAGAIFSISPTIGEAKAYYADIQRRAACLGRTRCGPLIFPGMSTILGGTLAEAQARHRAVLEQPTLAEAIDFLGPIFSYHDFSQYDPDAPFPDLGEVGHNTTRSYTDLVKRVAREEGLSLAQTAMRFATPQSRFVGTPETVADAIQEWFLEGAADGFILVAGGQDFTEFLDQVLPILRKRGLFREDYEHDTLRGHLGLDFPVNRYAPAHRPEAAVAGVAQSEGSK